MVWIASKSPPSYYFTSQFLKLALRQLACRERTFWEVNLSYLVYFAAAAGVAVAAAAARRLGWSKLSQIPGNQYRKLYGS